MIRTKKTSSHESSWLADYTEFLESPEVPPRTILADAVQSKVHQLLHPNPILVFSKLSFIHLFIGTLTLLFCPYSSICVSPDFGPMHFLMNYGESVCMLGCGAFFLSASLAVACLVLRPEEVVALRKNRFLQIGAVALLSLVLFICTDILFLEGSFWVWAIGSIVGGLVTLELGWWARAFFRRQSYAASSRIS